MLESQDHDLLEQIIDKYPEEEKCILSIKHYIEAKFEYSISNEEMMYLIIHINRVINRN